MNKDVGSLRFELEATKGVRDRGTEKRRNPRDASNSLSDGREES